jgi:hypothetical protein
MHKPRVRLTYANVMATIAVFIALGGASYAATQLPKNSVGTKQLKTNAVTGIKVKDRSLGGADIDLGSLGTVPSATNASHAIQADTANHANSADSATTAGNADTLDDLNSTDFQRSGASGTDTAYAGTLAINELIEVPVAGGTFYNRCDKINEEGLMDVGWGDSSPPLSAAEKWTDNGAATFHIASTIGGGGYISSPVGHNQYVLVTATRIAFIDFYSYAQANPTFCKYAYQVNEYQP